MYNINNWEYKKLGEICFMTSGGTPSRNNQNYYKGNIPWVKSGELNYNIIRDTEEKITKEAIENSSAKIFPKGTLLIALYGATIGKLGILGIDASTNQAVCGIYENDKISTKYLYWYLFSNRQEFIKIGFGGAQPNISQTILKDFDIPLPPIIIQQKTVDKIEELFSELDSGVEELKKVREQIKVYRQSVLNAAFTGKLTEEWRKQQNEDWQYERVADSNKSEKSDTQLPEGWKKVKLGEFLKVKSGNGLITSKMDINGKYYVYGGNGISGNHNEYMFEESKLIIGRVGAKCGVMHITKQKSWVTDNALICEFDINSFDIKFLYYLLTELNLNMLSVSTAQPVISGAKIYQVERKIPELPEQKQIVLEIESRLSIADEVEKTINESLQKAESLKQSILKKAFEGKLV